MSFSSLASSRSNISASFLIRISVPASICAFMSLSRFSEPLTVLKFVIMPPSQR